MVKDLIIKPIVTCIASGCTHLVQSYAKNHPSETNLAEESLFKGMQLSIFLMGATIGCFAAEKVLQTLANRVHQDHPELAARYDSLKNQIGRFKRVAAHLTMIVPTALAGTLGLIGLRNRCTIPTALNLRG